MSLTPVVTRTLAEIETFGPIYSRKKVNKNGLQQKKM